MTLLRVLVGALIVSTAVHYTDNWLSIEDYAPREGLIADNPGLVPVAWVLFTLLGLAAYREYRKGLRRRRRDHRRGGARLRAVVGCARPTGGRTARHGLS